MSIETLNITIPVPCVQGKFGSRLATYSTQISPLQIRKILGHDPRSRFWKNLPPEIKTIYERVQRPTVKSRRDGIAGYIEDRLTRNIIGAFPAISIGITTPMAFRSFEGPGMSKAIGNLEIDEEGIRILLDGLGRLSGALDLAEEGPEGMKLVNQFVFPVTFYTPTVEAGPLSVEDLGQLFMDFNFRVNPVPARLAIALDQSDIYISLANKLAKEPFIADNGGMEMKTKSLGKKSTALVVQSVLLRAVRGACEGRDFQEANLSMAADPNLTNDTFDQELESIAEFFTEIAQRMGHDRWKNRESLHLTAPGWQALGVIHHDINHSGLDLSDAQRSSIYNVIAGIDWSRKNQEWADEAKLGLFQNGELVILGAGRNNTQAIITYVRQKTGLAAKLESLSNASKDSLAAA
ncbi:DNA sulfur modification protein DndB [Acidocella aquatica]|nr:DNA sulfur modification protein DndB [Acidocella aquatica]